MLSCVDVSKAQRKMPELIEFKPMFYMCRCRCRRRLVFSWMVTVAVDRFSHSTGFYLQMRWIFGRACGACVRVCQSWIRNALKCWGDFNPNSTTTINDHIVVFDVRVSMLRILRFCVLAFWKRKKETRWRRFERRKMIAVTEASVCAMRCPGQRGEHYCNSSSQQQMDGLKENGGKM